ncbi:DUF3806 domain-containing protein [Sanguibacter antarcticus]|uniref:Uncharacterized protein DUF3806 n=1 Tax=Sanguibacter antarcticus TaxID=372484 RepID=A0A2A9EAB9_9MICO|nr:DUF3806 domain-containing protein [Sanguibacter antarcticus]PFG35215.1 uncharacterized protein DUF3806 [Sanguibacter antarcticus]
MELREPTPVDLVWMEELRLHLRSPGTDVTSLESVSTLFDTYCQSWHDAPEGARWNPNHVITALGICLGDILVAQSPGSHWMLAVDPRITSVAVRNDLYRGTIFPVDAVARRWIACELGWMSAFIDATRVALHEALSRGVQRDT